jgi:hypothetical protein
LAPLSHSPAYETTVNGFGTRLDNYNQQVATLDDLKNDLETDENTLRDMNKRMLSAVEALYGADSSEYEAAGGTRVSDRKRLDEGLRARLRRRRRS